MTAPANTEVFAGANTEVYRLMVSADHQRIVIKGPGEAVFGPLRAAGMKPIYIGGGAGGWVLDRHKRGVDRLSDVLARLQSAGHRVKFTGEPVEDLVELITTEKTVSAAGTGMLW